MTVATVSMGAVMRDLYPGAGTRIKQYVVELRREGAWERETCPLVDVPEHNDNTGTGCRNVGSTPWMWLAHDCCDPCGELHDATTSRPDVAAWRALRAGRPPITSDREALSNEVQEDFSMADNPVIAFIRKSRSR